MPQRISKRAATIVAGCLLAATMASGAASAAPRAVGRAGGVGAGWGGWFQVGVEWVMRIWVRDLKVPATVRKTSMTIDPNGAPHQEGIPTPPSTLSDTSMTIDPNGHP